jgi:outer membrane protein assembly factor BamB
MTVDQLIFVGFNGRVAALDRDTGEIVWSNNQLHKGNVTFLLDGDRLIVSVKGYIYCLDPLTGQILWHNPMKGFGYGIASLASVRGSSMQVVVQQAAQEEEAAQSAAAAHTSGM